jgi:hypothetical protein
MSEASDQVLEMIRDADDHETIVFEPSGALPREIDVLVTRNPLRGFPGAPQVPAQCIEITAANDPVHGIASDELDSGLDKVQVAERVGGAAGRRSIGRILRHDAGEVVLEVS